LSVSQHYCIYCRKNYARVLGRRALLLDLFATSPLLISFSDSHAPIGDAASVLTCRMTDGACLLLLACISCSSSIATTTLFAEPFMFSPNVPSVQPPVIAEIKVSPERLQWLSHTSMPNLSSFLLFWIARSNISTVMDTPAASFNLVARLFRFVFCKNEQLNKC
jgi:hypothetical protein